MATTTTTTTTNANTTKGSRTRQLLSTGAVAGVAATAVNAAVYGLGRAGGIDYVAQRDASGVDRIQIQHVVGLSVTAFVIGLAAALVVGRVRRAGLKGLQALGVVVALVSTYGDFGIDGSTAAKVTLISMHLVVGAAYVAALQRVRTADGHRAATVPTVSRGDVVAVAA
jgi:hypothetical protein